MDTAPRNARYVRADEFRGLNGSCRILVALTGYSSAQHRQMSAELAERALVQLD